MAILPPTPSKIARLVSALVVVLLLLPRPSFAKRKAVLHLKNPAAGVQIPFVEVLDLKLNRSDKLRLGDAPSYGKNEYGLLRRIDLGDVQSIEWSEQMPDQMRIRTNSGQELRCRCLPDGVNFSGAVTRVETSIMQSALFEGNFIGPGRRGKGQVQAKEVRRIFFAEETVPLDQIVFQLAEGQNTIASWKEAVDTFTSMGSPRVAPARENLTKAYLLQARTRLETFQKGGSLTILREGGQFAAEALKVIPDHAESRQLKDTIDSEEKKLLGGLEQARTMAQGQQWDAALDALKPLLHFSNEITEIAQLQQRSLEGSHQVHREEGLARLKAGDLETAIRELTVATQRIPGNQTTRQELRDAQIQLDMKIGGAELARGNFQAAYDVVSGSITKQGSDTRSGELLDQVRTKWADKLFADAQPLYLAAAAPAPAPPAARAGARAPAPAQPPAPRLRSLDSPAVEADLVKALGLLEKAHELVPSDKTETPIGQIRDNLGKYYLDLGTKKLNEPRGTGVGQAFLYLDRARGHQPNLAGVVEAREQARVALRRKASVGVNIVFQDRTTRKNADAFAQQVAASVGSAIIDAKLPGVELVDREAFDQLTQEVALTQKFSAEGGIAMNVRGAGVKVLGDILAYDVRKTDQTLSKPSRFISGYRENPESSRLMAMKLDLEQKANYEDGRANQLEACVRREQEANRQAGREIYPKVPGSCRYEQQAAQDRSSNYSSQQNDVERALQNTPAQLPIPGTYTYSERQVKGDADIRAVYRFTETVTSVISQQKTFQQREPFSATEVFNVQAADTNGIRERHDPIPDDLELLDNLGKKMWEQVAQDAIAYLRGFARAYLTKARSARDRGAIDEATEYYILFAYTASNQTGNEYQEAVDFLEKRNLEVTDRSEL